MSGAPSRRSPQLALARTCAYERACARACVPAAPLCRYVLWIELLNEMSAEKKQRRASASVSSRPQQLLRRGLLGSKQKVILERALERYPRSVALWQIRLASKLRARLMALADDVAGGVSSGGDDGQATTSTGGGGGPAAAAAAAAAAAGKMEKPRQERRAAKRTLAHTQAGVGSVVGLHHPRWRKQMNTDLPATYERALAAVGAGSQHVAPLVLQFLDFEVAAVAVAAQAASDGSTAAAAAAAKRRRRLARLFTDAMRKAHGVCVRPVAERYLRWALAQCGGGGGEHGVSGLRHELNHSIRSNRRRSNSSSSSSSSARKAADEAEGTKRSRRGRASSPSSSSSSSSSESSSDSDSDSDSGFNDDDDDDDDDVNDNVFFGVACTKVVQAVSTRRDVPVDDAYAVYDVLLRLHAISTNFATTAATLTTTTTQEHQRRQRRRRRQQQRRGRFLRTMYEAAVAHLGDSPAGAAMWARYLAHAATAAAGSGGGSGGAVGSSAGAGSRTALHGRAMRDLTGTNRELFAAAATAL